VANHKSAEKRARQAERRRARNRSQKSRVRSLVKQCRDALTTGAAGVAEQLRQAESALARAAGKGVIPKRRASRTISRLAKRAARGRA
jgi:small subunit ribosomal protein S20